MAALRSPDLFTPHPTLGPGGVLPALTPEEYAGLKDSIARDGIMQPIVVAAPENVILDGHHRWLIAKALGHEKVPVMLVETGDDAAHLRLGLSLNSDRRHMTAEQRKGAAVALLRNNPEQSNNAVAKAVGLSDKTVALVREEMVGRSEIPNVETRADTKGRKQPAHKSGTVRHRRPKAETPEQMAAAITKAAEKHVAPPTPTDGGLSRSPVSTMTEASEVPEVPGGPGEPEVAAPPRASSVLEGRAEVVVDGPVVLFVRALRVPCYRDVEGMTDEDAKKVALLRRWCDDVLATYGRDT